jgi:hypothetical protein
MSGLDLEFPAGAAGTAVRMYQPDQSPRFGTLPEISERGRAFLKELHAILDVVLPDLDSDAAAAGRGSRIRSVSVVATAQPQESLA